MTGRRIDPGDPDFGRLWTSFRYTARRIETLQVYDDPAEAGMRDAFLAGQLPVPDDDLLSWCQLIEDASAEGKLMQRVHVVHEPVSAYMAFELWTYAWNAAAGEEIRIIPVAGDEWPQGVPHADPWIFDSRLVCSMIYDSGGRLTHAGLDDDPASVAWACQAWDAAWYASIPYQVYMDQRRPGRLAS